MEPNYEVEDIVFQYDFPQLPAGLVIEWKNYLYASYIN